MTNAFILWVGYSTKPRTLDLVTVGIPLQAEHVFFLPGHCGNHPRRATERFLRLVIRFCLFRTHRRGRQLGPTMGPMGFRSRHRAFFNFADATFRHRWRRGSPVFPPGTLGPTPIKPRRLFGLFFRIFLRL